MITEKINYINIREILSRVTKHPMLKDLTLEDAINYTVDFIAAMGMPTMYFDNIAIIPIKDYRGILPCDLISINQVKNHKTGICLRSMSDNFAQGLMVKIKNIDAKDSRLQHPHLHANNIDHYGHDILEKDDLDEDDFDHEHHHHHHHHHHEHEDYHEHYHDMHHHEHHHHDHDHIHFSHPHIDEYEDFYDHHHHHMHRATNDMDIRYHKGYYYDKYEDRPHHYHEVIRPIDPARLIDPNVVGYMDSFRKQDVKISDEETFKTQGNIIYTSFRDGNVEISYKTMPVDKDGFPLLPDNPIFLKALELYIKKERFTVLFDLGKLDNRILDNTQREYGFAVKECDSEFVIPSTSEMESISRMWTAMIPRMTEFDNGFKTLGNREYLKDR